MRAGMMRGGVDKSDVWHFREQRTKQCDTRRSVRRKRK